MQQFFLVPSSMYFNNKVSDNQAIKRKELSKYPAEQNPTNQIDSINEEMRKSRLFG